MIQDYRRTLPATAIVLATLLALAACSEPEREFRKLDDIARDYVVLALAAGKHDENFVDAYYGPDDLAEQAESDTRSIEEVRKDASRLLAELRELPLTNEQDIGDRRNYLKKQLVAMVARLGSVQGVELGFDQEARRLFDTLPETIELAQYDPLRARIAELLPGDESLPQRVQAFRKQFVIPDEKLDAVFEHAIEECRRRTLARLDLPESETFRLEYVTDKPWSGYNWYQGGYHSLIQLNRSLPIELDRVVHLGCHEGYPGHHTYNALLENTLVEGRGWVEFSVYPLYSPQSLIAEGSANFGVELAFPGDELDTFEQEVLLPLAGIETDDYARYRELRRLLDKLKYAEIQVARQYLDGEIDSNAAREALIHYTLLSPERAEQRVSFIDTYRSYIINYTLGKDIVADWIERQADNVTDNETARWQAFGELLGSPRLPSDLYPSSAD